MWTLESTLPNETFPPQRVGHLNQNQNQNQRLFLKVKKELLSCGPCYELLLSGEISASLLVFK